jgi:hypothetical protein
MTKKLFDEHENIYQITVINSRLNELQKKGAALQKIGKPTKNGTKMTFAPVRSTKKYEAEMQQILERYSQTPQIEVLVKLGMTDVVEKLVKCYYGIVADENARRPDQFLGIRKERVKQLIRKKGDTPPGSHADGETPGTELDG